MYRVVGVDIGGTHFRLGLFNQEGPCSAIKEGETLRSGGRDWMLQQVRERCLALMAGTDSPVGACGISFGGPVDFERQQVTSIHVPGWNRFALAEWAQDSLNLPCRIDNDANAGALGEYRFGAGRGTESMVYITLSTGIGGGLVWGGKVFRGKDNMAGEIGHVPMSESGVLCSCGARGCLETLSSGTAIAQMAQHWARRRPDQVVRLLDLSGGKVESITAKTVFEAAREGDRTSSSIVREAAHWLARGLLTVIRILNTDRIVLGGGLIQAGALLMDPLREFLHEFRSPSIGSTTEILPAELGGHSPLYGAAAVALDLLRGSRVAS